MGSFCKTEDCPPSERLLAFETGDLDLETSAAVRRHLMVCEFCAAEIEFYGMYPPVEEKVAVDQIPEPLLELAEALLHKKRDLRSLYELARKGD